MIFMVWLKSLNYKFNDQKNYIVDLAWIKIKNNTIN